MRRQTSTNFGKFVIDYTNSNYSHDVREDRLKLTQLKSGSLPRESECALHLYITLAHTLRRPSALLTLNLGRVVHLRCSQG